MKKIAIIPARGGSKRIPKKNIKNFLGRPCISYSIDTAIKSKLFDEVIVSTDDQEIAQIAIEYGAKVPFIRSKKNSNDYATTLSVLKEVLNQYKKLDINYDLTCCIYPTAPLLTVNQIIAGFKLINKEDFNVVTSSVKYSHPIQRAFSILVNKQINFKNPENINLRTQDLKEYYHDAGQFYWLKNKSIEKNKSLLNGKVGSIIIDESLTHDIDNETDWLIAETKYRVIKNLIDEDTTL